MHGKIGSEGRVVDLVEAKVLESGNDAPGGDLSRLQAKALAQAYAHGRRDLHNDRFARIGEQAPNLIDFRLDRQARRSGKRWRIARS
jgi:hypothetical protein